MSRVGRVFGDEVAKCPTGLRSFVKSVSHAALVGNGTCVLSVQVSHGYSFQ